MEDTFGDNRTLQDRRRRPTPILSLYTFKGRRKGARRKGEEKNIYVDVYELKVAVAVIAILVLSILDGFFTFVFLEKGGKELNALVDWLIHRGAQEFFVVKAWLTGIALVFLVIHKNFVFVKKALFIILFFYALLFFYHLFIQILLYF